MVPNCLGTTRAGDDGLAEMGNKPWQWQGVGFPSCRSTDTGIGGSADLGRSAFDVWFDRASTLKA